MAFIREYAPVKFLYAESKVIEDLYIAVNFSKKKQLLSCSCNPKKDNIKSHLDAYGEIWTDILHNNVESMASCMQSFLQLYGLKNSVPKPTCYKNPEKHSSVDLMLTNSSSSFQCFCVIETGLSHFHQMTVTDMKTTFPKPKPKITY